MSLRIGSGGRLWLGSAVLAAAVLVGTRTLGQLLLPGPWSGAATTVVVVLAALVATLRRFLRSRLAPTVWGLVLLLLLVASLYGGPTASPDLPRPTLETVDRLRILIAAGIQGIADGSIPVQPVRGLEMLVVVGAALGYLVAELLALGFGRGGLAGLVLALLWVPVIAFERAPGFWLLVAGGTTFLLLLAVTRPRSRQADRATGEEVPFVVAAAAGVTVVALGLGGVASAMPLYGSVNLPSGWGSDAIDSPLRISTDLDMRSDLAPRSDRPLFRYTTDRNRPGTLRMYTLAEFDGREWLRGDPPASMRTVSGTLWPGQVPELGPETNLQIEILALNQNRMPIPTEPRQIEADGLWFYDPSRDEVVGADTSTSGLSYEVTFASRDLDADVLAGATVSGDALEDVDQYLQVPATAHVQDIRALANEVTAGADSPYHQAMLLQTFFRDVENFDYSTNLDPPVSEDAVWDFLTSRRGYCVQFATAMTIMARMLGIPARVGIGFLQGLPDESQSRTWVVSARQAHAWPELYFDDLGWVRFEPTPARQTGLPPQYADPYFGLPITPPVDVPTSTARPGQQGGQAGPGSGGGGYVTIGQLQVPTYAVVATPLAIAAAGALLLLLRRRRHRLIPATAEEWWTRLRERLASHGITWSDATTPRQAGRLVRGRYPAPDDAAAAALDRMVAAIETERYTTRDPFWTPSEIGEWVDAAERPLVSTERG